MLRRTNIKSVVMVIAVFIATCAMLGTVVAQKAAVPKPLDTRALGEAEVKQLLLLMDTDKNGKIFKQEWIRFMDAEFQRLDVEKRGEIDRKQLLQSTVSVGHVRSAGWASCQGRIAFPADSSNYACITS